MTDMLYYSYEGNFQLECDAEITQCVVIDQDTKEKEVDLSSNTKTVQLSLNQTVLHAQGGGQPTDLGTIEVEGTSAIVQVHKILLDRSTQIATHTGTVLTSDTIPKVGDKVRVKVDAENRLILSECHTAGHVVDGAMAKCGLLPAMETSKAYHFLDGPCVEYKGNIPVDERAPLLKKLQSAYQELVEEDIPTEIQVVPKDKALELCSKLEQDYFKLSEFGDEPVRLVTVANWICPCGGTHVKSTGCLKQRNWGITGIKCKKGIVKVKYDQNWDNSK